MSIKAITSLTPAEVRSELHRIRLQRGFTYERFAQEIGVSKRNLSKFMNERCRVRDLWLAKLVTYVEAERAERRSATADDALHQAVQE